MLAALRSVAPLRRPEVGAQSVSQSGFFGLGASPRVLCGGSPAATLEARPR
jgi:hypothetical protein